MLAATARGTSSIWGLGGGEDVAATVECLRRLGTEVRLLKEGALVAGRGIASWQPPEGPLDCANSGTTMRTLAGLAARCHFEVVLDGDASLRRRPMERVARPLRAMGAVVELVGGRPPLRIRGGELSGIEYFLDVPSAQVKTSVLFAGLGARGPTTVVEPAPSRDHTERLLRWLGVPVRSEGGAGSFRVTVEPADVLPFELSVPGDPSAAAFLVAAGVLGGDVVVEHLGLNPRRTRFFEILGAMGGDVTWTVEGEWAGEPVGEIRAGGGGRLVAVECDGSDPRLQDELPLLALVATQARGETVVRGAAELRYKESDRIDTTVRALRALGAEVHELSDGFVVRGPARLRGGVIDPSGDHRLAMMGSIAGLAADGEVRVTGFECTAVSWPGFERTLAALGGKIEIE